MVDGERFMCTCFAVLSVVTLYANSHETADLPDKDNVPIIVLANFPACYPYSQPLHTSGKTKGERQQDKIHKSTNKPVLKTMHTPLHLLSPTFSAPAKQPPATGEFA